MGCFNKRMCLYYINYPNDLKMLYHTLKDHLNNSKYQIAQVRVIWGIAGHIEYSFIDKICEDEGN